MRTWNKTVRRAAACCARAYKKFGALLCAFLLVGVFGVTAVWVRGALVARATAVPRAAALPALVQTPAPAASPAPAPVAYARPSAGEVLRGFSPDAPVWSETLSLFETHAGVDYAGAGDALASADGVVTRVHEDKLWGLSVSLSHADGAQTVYASLSRAYVRAGERVRAGQPVGAGGASAVCEGALGPHLHFCYLSGGRAASAPFLE